MITMLVSVCVSFAWFPSQGSTSPAPALRGRLGAFSLTEMLVVVAVIAIIATIAVPMMQLLAPSKDQVAVRNLNYLNGAVVTYNQAVEELPTNASTSDIMGMLQARDAQNHGSPYLPDNLRINTTSDPSTYRATWSNRMFILIQTNAAGTGLDLLKLM